MPQLSLYLRMTRINNKLNTQVQSLVSYMIALSASETQGPEIRRTWTWSNTVLYHPEILNTFEQVAPHLHVLDGSWNCRKKLSEEGDREPCGGRGGQQGLNTTLCLLSYTRLPSWAGKGSRKPPRGREVFLCTKLTVGSLPDSSYKRGQWHRLPSVTGIFRFSSPAARPLAPL